MSTRLCLQLNATTMLPAGHQQAASSVHYTTSCKHSLVLLRMGEIIARNMLSWFKLLIKLLFLLLFWLFILFFHNLFISVRRCTCFRRVFRPSSGAQNCTYSVRYWSDKYLRLYAQFSAPGDGRKTRLRHVERLTEINKLWNVASCWLYSENKLAMHGPMTVEVTDFM